MIRVFVGLLFLAIAAALLGYAGGLDVTSPAGWRNAVNEWSLPSKEQNERGLVLILGALAALLAIIRLITPRRRKDVAINT